MDFVAVKQEAFSLEVHLSVATDLEGRFLGFQTTKIEQQSDTQASEICLSCPQCDGLLNITIVVHHPDANSNQAFDEKASTDIKRNSPSPVNYFSDREDDTNLGNNSDDQAVVQSTNSKRKKKGAKLKNVSESKTNFDSIQPKVEIHESAESLNQSVERAGDKPSVCTFCSKAFRSMAAVKRHEKIVHRRLYVQRCEQCGIECRNSYHLAQHLEGHKLGDFKPYKCALCNAEFSLKYKVKAHMERVHLSVKDSYQCEVCSKKFKNYPLLYKHKKRHDPKPFKCQYCGKEWVYKSELDQHERTHKDERRHCCELCGRSYKEKTDLTKHIKRIHTIDPTADSSKGGPPKEEFQCEICTKVLVGKNSYSVHMIMHKNGPDSLECSQCGLKLKNKHSMKLHISRLHLPKEFVCRFCGRPWRYKSELIQHELIHTDTRQFACPLCDVKFKLKGDLNRHIQLHSKREDKIVLKTAVVE